MYAYTNTKQNPLESYMKYLIFELDFLHFSDVLATVTWLQMTRQIAQSKHGFIWGVGVHI